MAFGKFRLIQGFLGQFKSTLVPVKLLQNLKKQAPIPITVSGSNQVTFTINASKTAPVFLWVGEDYIELKENLAYTWTNGSNAILSSAGAATAVTASTLGVWYFYVSVASDGTLTLKPSQTAPSYAEHRFGGSYMHPGTSSTTHWGYVGYHVCTTAATPVFLAVEKNGFVYSFLDQSVATTTTWALLDFSGVLPAHGVTANGFLETSATSGDTIEIGTSSTNLRGQLTAKTPAAVLMYVPFSGIVVNSAGKFYGSSTTAAGDVHVTQVVDIV
jgi:hypothetical protein